MIKLCFLADANSIHTQKWVQFFARKNYEVYLVSFQNAHIPGVTIHAVGKRWPIMLNPSVSALLKFRYFFYFNKIKKIIHQIEPDILHAHWATTYGFVGAYSCYHPFILSAWGSDIFNFPRKSFFHKKIIEFNLSRADYLTATSKILTQEVKRYLDRDTKIFTIPFGVDLKIFKPKNNRMNNSITIGVVKTLEKKYGIEYLIRAFACIAEKNSKLRLLIIGKGSQEKKLKRLSKKLNIYNRILFSGFINNNQIPSFLNQMDIFVVPSIVKEAFGVAVIEAAACGLPVIASDVGGLREVVQDGQTGLLVRPKDINDLAEKLNILINRPCIRENMGKEGRAFVERMYDWDENVVKMEVLYNKVIQKII